MLSAHHNGVYIEYENEMEKRISVTIEASHTFLVEYEADILDKITEDDGAQAGREVLLEIYGALKKNPCIIRKDMTFLDYTQSGVELSDSQGEFVEALLKIDISHYEQY